MNISKDHNLSVNPKKGLIFIAVFLTLALAFFVSTKYAKSADNETKAKNLEITNFDANSATVSGSTAQIDSQRLEANSLSGQNYQWQSQVIHSDFPFDALGASWSKDDQSKINLYARFSKDNKPWEDWQEFDPTDEGEANEKSTSANSNTEEVANLLFSKDAQYFQYKVVFKEKINSSFLESIKFTYIKPSDISNQKFSLLNYLGIKKAKAINSPRIISRAEWGANPAYMTWPPEYVRPNKIIIHHTASGNNPPDPAAVVRSIYYYHAVSLGWGDIGYNYLFDQNGNIYEGRAGGNMVVGAHAYGQNYGSVGLSAIGDFSSTDITASTLGSLTDMTAYKAYENDFDITYGTVFGHRDFCNNPPGHNCTACPGGVLYGRKGQIIDDARQKVSTYLQRDRDFLNQNDNVLVKSYSQPEVYLWKDGVKKHIADPKTFALFGYSWSNINYVSIIALNEKSAGPKLSAFVKTADDPKIYMLKKDPEVRYWITDMNLFNDFGFGGNSVVIISSEEMNAISYAGPLKSIIKAINTAPIYHLASGKKEHFANLIAFEGWGINPNDVLELPQAFVDQYPLGRELYNLVTGGDYAIYLLQNGNRYHIPSPAMFESWGLKWNQIAYVTPEQLSVFPEGQNLSRIAKGNGATVYLIDNNKKHYFADPATLALWEKSPQDVFPADDRLLDDIPTGFQVTDLIRSPDRPEVYLMFNGKKYHLADPQTFYAWNKNWSDIRLYSNELLNEFSLGETTLTRYVKKLVSPEEPEIYLISGGQKKHFPNPNTFFLWGGTGSNVSRIPLGLFDSLAQGNDVSVAIKGSGPEIYLLDRGRKDHIISPEAFNAWGITDGQITTISDQEINSLPDGPKIGFLIKADDSAPIYKVEAGKKAHIPSPDILYAWGFSFNNVAVVSPLLSDILPNDTALSIFAKTSASDQTVYLMNQIDKKQFTDNSILEAWTNNSSPSIAQSINKLPTNGTVARLAQGPGPEIYLILSGKKYHISDPPTFFAWGFNMNQVTILSQATINSIIYGGELTRLVMGSGPEIYLIDGGQKRHIPSPEIFYSYGWNWSSITTLSDSFIGQLPVGPDVPFNVPSVPSLNITANGPYTVINSSGQTIGTANGGDHLLASYYNGTYYLLNTSNAILWSGGASIKFVPNSGDVITEVSSYSDPNYNGSANYNRFRGSIEIVHSGSGTWAVNELSLNDYTAGICEAPGGHPEYLKTMAVAARSYGLWHLSRGGKHAGEPFHLMNSRRGNGNDQVYCGYGYEAIASYYAPQARATDNQVVLYNWSPALTAYSHGSYPSTRSARDVWGIDYPWLQAVPDPYGDQNRPCGTGGNHCVGLSASGAIGFAERGSSYLDILRHYYQGTGVADTSAQNIRIAIYAF